MTGNPGVLYISIPSLSFTYQPLPAGLLRLKMDIVAKPVRAVRVQVCVEEENQERRGGIRVHGRPMRGLGPLREQGQR